MQKIDFYVLQDASKQQSLRYACELIEASYKEQKKIYVHTETLAEAERFDDLLWTFRDDAFVPHQLHEANDGYPHPVKIGCAAVLDKNFEVLVNLNKEIPAFSPQFVQVIEIVFNDALVQQWGRERFRQYREQGCDIQTHKIKVNTQ